MTPNVINLSIRGISISSLATDSLLCSINFSHARSSCDEASSPLSEPVSILIGIPVAAAIICN